MPILSSAPAPQHAAITRGGHRRWAARRSLPRALGHASAARRGRHVVQACAARGVRCLAWLALSTENGKRPAGEVPSLMGLLVHHLQKQISNRHAKGVCLKALGDLSRFDPRLQSLMACGQALTAHSTAITLASAANYGGRGGTVQAVPAWQSGYLALAVDDMDDMDGAALRPCLRTADAPDPELLICTEGESRLSNFMGWQMAGTALFFTDTLRPDFSVSVPDDALQWFIARGRRFGASSALLAR